jgi:hypothetical protein
MKLKRYDAENAVVAVTGAARPAAAQMLDVIAVPAEPKKSDWLSVALAGLAFACALVRIAALDESVM